MSLATIAALLLLWLLSQDDQRLGRAPSGSSSSTKATDKTLSPSAVLSIAASRSSLPEAHRSNTAPMSLVHEFNRADRLRPLYDRLKSGADKTADGKLALYLILRGCATQEINGKRDSPTNLLDKSKALEASISDSNPEKQMRLEVARGLKQRCEGFDQISTSREELQALLNQSAAEGNPSARVRLVAQQLEAATRPGQPPPVTESQLSTLRQAIGSGDPNAIFEAGLMLSNSFSDLIVESSASHEPLQPSAAFNAWRLLACEYGADCGPSNLQLRVQCAFDGECSATNVQDSIFFYKVPPYQAQLIDEYRNIFRNAANGDWSGLDLARKPGGAGSRYYFSIP